MKNGSGKKWFGAVVLILMLGLLTGSAVEARADSYTEWSAWSTAKPSSATGRQIQTRRVISSYDLIAYFTQEEKSPYYRNVREYSINGNYSHYGARPSYGEFKHTGSVPAGYIDAAAKYSNGAYITNGGKSAYHRGNGTAYLLQSGYGGTDRGPWFISKTNYQTQYRYRDLIVDITDPTPIELPPVTIGPVNPGSDPVFVQPTFPVSGDSGSNESSGNTGNSSDQTPDITDHQCTNKGIRIYWKIVPGVSGYYIFRNGKQIATVNGGNKNTYLDRKAKKNGKKYKYAVCPFTKSGGKIRKGKKCRVVVIIYLITVKKPKTKTSPDSITVTWTPNKKCQGYEILISRNRDFKDCQVIRVKGKNKKSKTIKGLSPETVYYIKIRVYYIINGKYCYSPFTAVLKVRTAVPVYVYKGCISNALDGQGLSGATLIFRSGKNNRTGKIYGKCTTGSKGRYSIRLKKGTYTVEIRRKNYVTIYITIYVIIDSPDYDSNSVSLSQPIGNKQFRIVLTWGEVPNDLDSHLTGPSNDYNGRFHVFFRNKSGYYNGKLAAILDVDDTTSYGPETVTTKLKIQSNGTYRYYVHDYTNRGKSYSTALGLSGAKVMVYSGNRLIATFKVPQGAGTSWHVFDITGGKLVKYNAMGYVNDPGTFY